MFRVIKDVSGLVHPICPVQEYDLFVSALGYESRSTYAAQTLSINSKRLLAIAFDSGHTLHFAGNYEWFSRHKFSICECDDSTVFSVMTNALHELTSFKTDQSVLSICIDISCFSRSRMADIVDAICSVSCSYDLIVDFVYSRAEYSSPNSEVSITRVIEPVGSRYRGSVRRIDLPRIAVVGIGYEDHLASAVIERLEASKVWSFSPLSADGRYDTVSFRANEYLWSMVPSERRFTYKLELPFDLFLNLESLVFGLSAKSNVFLVPLGPKMFSLCCLLVSLCHEPNVEVWRVSTSSTDSPSDRVPDGMVCGLRVRFSLVG